MDGVLCVSVGLVYADYVVVGCMIVGFSLGFNRAVGVYSIVKGRTILVFLSACKCVGGLTVIINIQMVECWY